MATVTTPNLPAFPGTPLFNFRLICTFRVNTLADLEMKAI